MDLQLAKNLAMHGAITGFHIYSGGPHDWFFNVVTTSSPGADANGDNGEPFETARGKGKHYKSLDALINDIAAINSVNRSGSSIPVHVHLS